MDILLFTSVLGLLPAIYPIVRIVRKQELNLFDLIILFHVLNFALVPLWRGNILHWTNDGIVSTFLYYITFVIFVLLVDLYWHNVYEGKKSLINITAYIKRYNGFKISKTGILLIFIILLASLVFYMPKATYILHLEDAGAALNHEETVQTLLLGNFFNIAGTVLILYFSCNVKKPNLKDVGLWLFLAYMIMNLFFPRRVFLSLLLQVLLCVYSLHRSFINRKVLVFASAFGVFLYFVYFPFYNIMRNGSSVVYFNPSAPIESLMEISSYAIDNWSLMSEDATKASDTRSLNLYDAVYDLIYCNPEPCCGELTWKAIDVSIPKAFNPNKGDGSAPILEKLAKQNSDQADSYLLIAYGDYHYFGSFYALFIYITLFSIYILYNRLLRKLFNVEFLSLFFALILFSLTWNVEASLDGFLSWFFSSVPALIIFVILEKFRLIQIHLGKKIVLNKKCYLNKKGNRF